MVSELSRKAVFIEKLVSGGDGLGHLEGSPVFVPLTAPGDLVIPEKLNRARGVLFARERTIVTPSARRRETPCRWFGQCGGCQWMHLPYSDQVRWKQNVFTETVERISGLGNMTPDSVCPSPVEFGYRHRVRLHYDGSKLGLKKRHSREVIQWDSCLQLPDLLNLTVQGIRKALDDGSLKGRLRSLELAVDPALSEVTACWLMDGPGKGGRAVDLDRVESTLAGEGITVAGQKVSTWKGGEVLAQRGSGLRLTVAGHPLKASPGTFFQANPALNELLVERVTGHLGAGKGRRLLDLFCGNGNFSIPSAASGFEVTGVEASARSVQDALSEAPEGAKFVAGDASAFLSGSAASWDVVIVDPPRTGLSGPMAEALAGLSAPMILYVSCEPATLARDLARLTADRYAVKTVELFDMFPQTSHVESLTVLELKT